MGPTADEEGRGGEAVIEAARTGAYDRYAAALLAEDPLRRAMMALAAFSTELSYVAPQTRREPRMGEIRLQWWREALAAEAASGHPIADAVREAAQAHAWPRERLIDIVDAHEHDGLADAFADDSELIATLSLGEGTLFALAARAAGLRADEDIDALCLDAGVAYGLARRLHALPQLVAMGHLPLPQSRLAAAGLDPHALLAGESAGVRGVILDLADLARDRLARARVALRPAPRKNRIPFLPLALVEPYLQRATLDDRNPLRDECRTSNLARLVRMSFMHAFARF